MVFDTTVRLAMMGSVIEQLRAVPLSFVRLDALVITFGESMQIFE